MAKAGAPIGNKNRTGKLNKLSMQIDKKLAELNCDPLEGMARIAQLSETAFRDALRELNNGEDVKIAGLYKDLALAGKMYTELAQYVAPKRKAIEHSGNIEGGFVVHILPDDKNV